MAGTINMQQHQQQDAQWRVKLYELEDNGAWIDKGTGYVNCRIVDEIGEPVIQVVGEGTMSEAFFQSRLQHEDVYELQGDNIIMWRELEASAGLGVDYALSFQEAIGCRSVWDSIGRYQAQFLQQREYGYGPFSSNNAHSAGSSSGIGVDSAIYDNNKSVNTADDSSSSSSNINSNIQGHNNSTNRTPIAVHGLVDSPVGSSPSSIGSGGVIDPFSQTNTFFVLPTNCEDENSLQRIRYKLENLYPAQRDYAVTQLMDADGAYFKRLFAIFETLEAKRDIPSLNCLAEIFRSVLLLNEPILLEHLLSKDEIFYPVAGIMEYDKSLREQGCYRDFLFNKASFREVVPLDEEPLAEELRANVTLLFRLKYTRDVILHPKIDDPGITAIGSMVSFASNDLCVQMMQNIPYLARVFKVILPELDISAFYNPKGASGAASHTPNGATATATAAPESQTVTPESQSEAESAALPERPQAAEAAAHSFNDGEEQGQQPQSQGDTLVARAVTAELDNKVDGVLLRISGNQDAQSTLSDGQPQPQMHSDSTPTQGCLASLPQKEVDDIGKVVKEDEEEEEEEEEEEGIIGPMPLALVDHSNIESCSSNNTELNVVHSTQSATDGGKTVRAISKPPHIGTKIRPFDGVRFLRELFAMSKALPFDKRVDMYYLLFEKLGTQFMQVINSLMVAARHASSSTTTTSSTTPTTTTSPPPAASVAPLAPASFSPSRPATANANVANATTTTTTATTVTTKPISDGLPSLAPSSSPFSRQSTMSNESAQISPAAGNSPVTREEEEEEEDSVCALNRSVEGNVTDKYAFTTEELDTTTQIVGEILIAVAVVCPILLRQVVLNDPVPAVNPLQENSDKTKNILDKARLNSSDNSNSNNGSNSEGCWWDQCTMFLCIDAVVNSPDPATIQSFGEVLKWLLDLEKAQTPAVKNKNNLFLTHFYEHYLVWLLVPYLGDLVPTSPVPGSFYAELGIIPHASCMHGAGNSNVLLDSRTRPQQPLNSRTSQPLNAISASRRNLFDIFTTCVQIHSYRFKYFSMRNNILSKLFHKSFVVALTASSVPVPKSTTSAATATASTDPSTSSMVTSSSFSWLHVCAIKFLKAVLCTKDEFYYKHLEKLDLLRGLFKLFKDIRHKDNLVTSNIHDVLEYIRSENIKNLVVYTVQKYSECFEDVKTVDVFDKLKLKYDQILDMQSGNSLGNASSNTLSAQAVIRGSHNGPLGGGPSAIPGARGVSGNVEYLSLTARQQNRKFREIDNEEEYFFGEDGEDEDDEKEDVNVQQKPPQQYGIDARLMSGETLVNSANLGETAVIAADVHDYTSLGGTGMRARTASISNANASASANANANASAHFDKYPVLGAHTVGGDGYTPAADSAHNPYKRQRRDSSSNGSGGSANVSSNASSILAGIVSDAFLPVTLPGTSTHVGGIDIPLADGNLLRGNGGSNSNSRSCLTWPYHGINSSKSESSSVFSNTLNLSDIRRRHGTASNDSSSIDGGSVSSSSNNSILNNANESVVSNSNNSNSSNSTTGALNGSLLAMLGVYGNDEEDEEEGEEDSINSNSTNASFASTTTNTSFPASRHGRRSNTINHPQQSQQQHMSGPAASAFVTANNVHNPSGTAPISAQNNETEDEEDDEADNSSASTIASISSVDTAVDSVGGASVVVSSSKSNENLNTLSLLYNTSNAGGNTGGNTSGNTSSGSSSYNNSHALPNTTTGNDMQNVNTTNNSTISNSNTALGARGFTKSPPLPLPVPLQSQPQPPHRPTVTGGLAAVTEFRFGKSGGNPVTHNKQFATAHTPSVIIGDSGPTGSDMSFLQNIGGSGGGGGGSGVSSASVDARMAPSTATLDMFAGEDFVRASSSSSPTQFAAPAPAPSSSSSSSSLLAQNPRIPVPGAPVNSESGLSISAIDGSTTDHGSATASSTMHLPPLKSRFEYDDDDNEDDFTLRLKTKQYQQPSSNRGQEAKDTKSNSAHTSTSTLLSSTTAAGGGTGAPVKFSLKKKGLKKTSA